MKNKNKSVCILLSSYNGEKYIAEQLDSLLKQRAVDLRILVRDDGSTDRTCSILEKYRQNGELDLIKGDNVGYAKSFYLLLKNAPASDYYAYCDQDDFWEEDKLIAAVSMLEKQDKEKPLLYYSALKVVDNNLNFLHNSHKNFKIGKYPFQESFTSVSAYGCTSVFNNIARNKLLKYDYEIFYAHDTNMNMMVSALGTVVFDSTPHVKYRQHESNAFGYPDLNIKKMLKRLFKAYPANMRLNEMQKIKKYFYNELTLEDKTFCDLVCNYKNSRLDRDNLLKYKPFKGKSFIVNIILHQLIRMRRF